LEKNLLSGPLPVELGNLTKLEDLFLYNNSFTGTVPPSLALLPRLTQLYVQYNYFEGTLGFTSTVPNSTYQFAPQLTPPPQPVSQGSFSPVLIPALISAVAFLAITVLMVVVVRRYKKQELQAQTDRILNRDEEGDPMGKEGKVSGETFASQATGSTDHAGDLFDATQVEGEPIEMVRLSSIKKPDPPKMDPDAKIVKVETP